MRAAMVGGVGYMAGKSAARGSQQEQPPAEVEAQQEPSYAAPAPPAPAAAQ